VARALGLLVAFVVGATVLLAQAQSAKKVAQVAVLYPAPDNPVFRKNFEGFRQRLRELGYVEGQNLKIAYWLPSETDPLTKVATDLVRSKPDVILGVAPAGVTAAHKATATISHHRHRPGKRSRRGRVRRPPGPARR
jgi:putative ABC transport system substrate-binding protein